jgi:hypothetical protein
MLRRAVRLYLAPDCAPALLHTVLGNTHHAQGATRLVCCIQVVEAITILQTLPQLGLLTLCASGSCFRPVFALTLVAKSL